MMPRSPYLLTAASNSSRLRRAWRRMDANVPAGTSRAPIFTMTVWVASRARRLSLR